MEQVNNEVYLNPIKESMFGLISGDIKASGGEIKCMAKEKLFGQTEEVTSGSNNRICSINRYEDDKKHGYGLFKWGDGR
jgi:hypothetical protein